MSDNYVTLHKEKIDTLIDEIFSTPAEPYESDFHGWLGLDAEHTLHSSLDPHDVYPGLNARFLLSRKRPDYTNGSVDLVILGKNPSSALRFSGTDDVPLKGDGTTAQILRLLGLNQRNLGAFNTEFEKLDWGFYRSITLVNTCAIVGGTSKTFKKKLPCVV
ncbi:MAG: hypothetical protein Q3972_07445 [Corynebacterium sp.]|nr:hypothetical protein [Corynebacterium sp.]